MFFNQHRFIGQFIYALGQLFRDICLGTTNFTPEATPFMFIIHHGNGPIIQ